MRNATLDRPSRFFDEEFKWIEGHGIGKLQGSLTSSVRGAPRDSGEPSGPYNSLLESTVTLAKRSICYTRLPRNDLLTSGQRSSTTRRIKCVFRWRIGTVTECGPSVASTRDRMLWPTVLRISPACLPPKVHRHPVTPPDAMSCRTIELRHSATAAVGACAHEQFATTPDQNGGV